MPEEATNRLVKCPLLYVIYVPPMSLQMQMPEPSFQGSNEERATGMRGRA